ncbi:inositol monophosphatase family protein [Nostocoides australiense]|nr:inositol monophosphatase family protein [Tetrasphaera australiensis]
MTRTRGLGRGGGGARGGGGGRDIRRGGSAALDLCHVADATLDGYYEHGLNPWDFGAGWLIVEEAGGAVAGPSGQAPDRPMTIAAGAGFGALSELVRRALEAADRG